MLCLDRERQWKRKGKVVSYAVFVSFFEQSKNLIWRTAKGRQCVSRDKAVETQGKGCVFAATWQWRQKTKAVS